jgi:glyoxylase-like metal-dependent hydrolase (beta-lactamase superfamily II)/rhodanese-related sulfurtransferase
MKIEQIYTGCLSEAAYYIQSDGEAAIIDPLRETEPYISRAEKDGVKIKYVFLTHFHADFVSGHVDLAKKTGATIVFGPNAKAAFDFHSAKDLEQFSIGAITIQLLHTPGHTMESSTYLLFNKDGKEHCIFTGDTLFIGDVGRPDLAVKSNLTDKDLASLLFDSLRNKIMSLPDSITVYPAHGAGSACGKNMSKETFDSLGNQKLVNYALRSDMSKEEFIEEVTTGITAPPQYFPKNVLMNQSNNSSIDDILNKGTLPLNIEDFQKLMDQNDVLLIDCRAKTEFVIEHIPGSLFFGLDGSFAPWIGTLIKDLNQKIILICPEGKENEAVTRLARTGYDHSIGYLKGGIKTWKSKGLKTSSITSIDPQKLESEFENISLIDVRKPNEYNTESVKGAINLPLDFIYNNIQNYNSDNKYYIHCQSGYRSVIASSILKANGINNVIDIAGGFKLIKESTDLELSDFNCPSKTIEP